MSVFDYFDRAYCVHLPNPERRAGMVKQFEAAGIKRAEFVHAETPRSPFSISNMRRCPPREFGANLSHIKAVVRAIADGAERALFVEDDIVFLHPEARLGPALAELPADWDVLYLGGHPRSNVQRFSPHLVKVGTFCFAEAYALSRKALLAFHDFWCDRIGQHDALYDIVLGEFAATTRGFCVVPLVTEQPPGYSYIGQKTDDKRLLVERAWERHYGLSIR